MSAAAIPGVIATALTNADWELDLIFCQGVETLVEDWTGSDVRVALWRKQGAESYRLDLNSATGEGLLPPTAFVPVALRVPAATMHTLPGAVFNGEVRRIFPNGAIEAVATFVVQLQAALPAPEGEPGGVSDGETGGSTVKVIRQIGSMRVVRAGGAQGLSAKQVVLASEPDDLPVNATDAEFAAWIRKPATDAAEAVLNPPGRLDFSRPNNSALIGVL